MHARTLGLDPRTQLIALRLYMRTAFGRLHGRNPEIINLARRIGRTPSAPAMKACNFASLDPAFLATRGKAGPTTGRPDTSRHGDIRALSRVFALVKSGPSANILIRWGIPA